MGETLLELVRAELKLLLRGSDRSTVVVAWSGGRDSSVLLDVVCRLRDELRFDLLAVHVDHRTRPSSRRDAAFCRRGAASRGIPLRTTRLEPPPAQASQQQLRRRRYGAVAREADRIGADVVTTAHHALDVVETALLNFSRGAGARGMSSLMLPPDVRSAPISSWPDVPLARPLRSVLPESVQSYAERRELDWVEDPTNSSEEDTRFRLRRSVITELTDGAGSIGSMIDSVRNLAGESTELRRRANRRYQQIHRGDANRDVTVLPAKRMAELERNVAVAVLEQALRELPGPVGWNRKHLLSVLAQVYHPDGPGGVARVTLRGAVASIDSRRIVLERTEGRGARGVAERVPEPATFSVASKGALNWFERRFEWRTLSPADPTAFPEDAATAWFDRDAVGDRLAVRGRESGTSFRPIGASSATEVREVLRAGEVPPTARWWWPILVRPPADEGDIVWVAGCRQAADYGVDAETDRVLEMRVLPRHRSEGR